MSHAYLIQITQAQKMFHLQVAGSITLKQLHQAILILFQWKDDGKFSFLNHRIIEDQEDLPVEQWLENYTTFQYTYYQKSKNENVVIKVIEQVNEFSHSIQLLYPEHHMQELQKHLDELFLDEELEQMTDDLLENIRTDLEQRKTIAPYLIITETDERPFLFYLDVLDNGMELMAFADENEFVRSILNSMNEDPDLLFTNAFTFDFLYEDIEHSELPLYHQHNLCFKNEPGQLPRAMDRAEKELAVELLNDFYSILKRTPVLPSLGDNQVLRVRENDIVVEAFHINRNVDNYDDEKDDIPTIPHTNEKIHLMLQAVPNGHEIKVHLSAINDHFTKTATVHMSPIATLQKEIDLFLCQLFQERGIAETFILHSRNLHQLISPSCEKLGIHCQYYEQQMGADLFLANMLAQAFPLADEECYGYQNNYHRSENKLFS